MSDGNSTAIMETPAARQQAIARQEQQPKPSALATTTAGRTGLVLGTFGEMYAFAKCLASSGLAPKGIDKPESIVIALQMGMELGLPPMASLQNIAVINGRPSLWGDAQLAVCRATGELAAIDEWFEQGGKRLPRNPATFDENTVAVCRVTRRGQEPIETGFSVADAKRAQLWGKSGPWTQYPARMMRFRARSFTLRDVFGDALRGLLTAEEATDTPAGSLIVSTTAGTGSASLNERLRATPAPATSAEPADEPVDGEVGEAQTAEPVAEPVAEEPATPADEPEPAAQIDPQSVPLDASTIEGFERTFTAIGRAHGMDDTAIGRLYAKAKLAQSPTRLSTRENVLKAFAAGVLTSEGKIPE